MNRELIPTKKTVAGELIVDDVDRKHVEGVIDEPVDARHSATPAQSHGVGERKWVPPVERFIIWEPEDEFKSWVQYCRIGTYDFIPIPMFDVCDPSFKVLGFTPLNPCVDDQPQILLPPSRNFAKFERVDDGTGKLVFKKPHRYIPVNIHYTGSEMLWVVPGEFRRELLRENFMCEPSNVREFWESMKRERRVTPAIQRGSEPDRTHAGPYLPTD